MRIWLFCLIPLWTVACYESPTGGELGREPVGAEPVDGPELSEAREDLSRRIAELGETLDEYEQREMEPAVRQRLDGLREQYDQLVERAERATEPDQLEAVRQQIEEMNAAVLLLGRDIPSGS